MTNVVNNTGEITYENDNLGILPARKFTRRKNPGSPRRLKSMERTHRALELRKAGSTYAQIAQVAGYATPQSAYQAIKNAMAAQPREDVSQLRAIQMARLEHMLLTLWPKVQGGDERAIDTSLRVMQQMDKLQGTEQPAAASVHIDSVLIIDGSQDDYIAQMKRMAGVSEPQMQPALGTGEGAIIDI